ncbi:MAG: sensor histidine kinase [Spirochaetales bacterium]|nr:sensor histidine kinase [Spirochaetales bacterium]
MNDKTVLVRLLLYAVNLGMIVYFSYIMITAIDLVCARFDARVFIERLRDVPIPPLRATAASLFLFIIVYSVEKVGMNLRLKGSDAPQLLVFIIMTVLCVGIMFFLNMENKGLLMIPAVYALSGLERRTQKTIALSIICSLYIGLDQSVASIVIPIVPLDTYIEYYPLFEKNRMNIVRTILLSSNEVLFIVYIALYIQSEIARRNRIEELNDRLRTSLHQLRVANVQLEEYSKKSEELAKLKERNRLAREIHDTIGHTLTGIEIGLKACLCLPENDRSALIHQVGKVYELARSGSKDVRLSLKELRPDALQRYSLLPALESLISAINSCSLTHSHLLLEDEIPELIASQEELVYRVVQETITNAVKHGEATDIEIRIGYDGSNLCISISDNGKGSDSVTEGFGLENIRRRVEFYRGSVSISSSHGKGFCLHVMLPLIRRSVDD